MTYLDEKKPSPEELLHFGVKGMKWGTHKKSDQPSGPSNRQLNKESRVRDKAARDKEIDDARERYKTSSRQNYLNAKTQYKADKKTIGTREAKKKFNAVKLQNMDDYQVAQQAKSGKETAIAVLSIVGTIAVSAILTARQ